MDLELLGLFKLILRASILLLLTILLSVDGQFLVYLISQVFVAIGSFEIDGLRIGSHGVP